MSTISVRGSAVATASWALRIILYPSPLCATTSAISGFPVAFTTVARIRPRWCSQSSAVSGPSWRLLRPAPKACQERRRTRWYRVPQKRVATTAYRIPHKCLEVTGYVLAGGRILWLDPRADARGNHGSLDDAHAIRSGRGAPRAACSTWNPEHIESETSFCTRPAYSASRSKYANPCSCRAGGRTCAAFRAACSGSTASTADGQMSLACQSLRHVLMTMRSH